MPKPPSTFSSVTWASVSSFVGAWPAWARPLASAIEKQVAWAAAISSSGLVLPPGCSKREAKVTCSSSTAWLDSRSNSPWPLLRSPVQVARALRSIAIVSLLFACSAWLVVRPALQLFRKVVHVKPGRVAVRVDVALSPAELFRAVVARVAELVGRTQMAVLAHVLRRLLDRD